ncbi:MAG: hypothetical protein HPY59_01505 [Anaerolineae bacterium]|nr:hypothetical protein [Anaerolineae bacterium]
MEPGSQSIAGTRRNLILWAALAALEALAGLVYLVLIPADPKNVVFLGYSLPRLGLMAGFLLLFLALVGLCAGFCRNEGWVNVFRQGVQQEKGDRFLWIAALLLIAGWVLVFLPLYRFGGWAGYAERLRPLFLWMLLVGIQSVFFLYLERSNFPRRVWLGQIIRSGGAALVVWGLSLLAWFLIALTGVGLVPDKVHWNDHGVPLLGLQTLAALALGVGLGRLVDWLRMKISGAGVLKNSGAWFEAAIWLAVWGCAALIWSQSPIQRNFFAPGPYPPNYEFYPFSDSVTYDLSAQLARIGLLYSGGAHVDKPLYSLLLLAVNFLSGNRYDLLLAWQAALLAALPMILYGIGKTLHSRAAGFAAAALLIFKEINAYHTVTIQVSHSKLILSEVPTALLLALFTFFMIRWFEGRGQKIGFAALAGGTLGLSTLLRHNPWFLLPWVGLAVLLVYRRCWRKMLLAGGLFLIVFLLGIVPWAVRTIQTTGSPLYFFAALKGVVWEQRYEPALQPSATPAFSPTPTLIPAHQPDSLDSMSLLASTAQVGGDESAGSQKSTVGIIQFVSAHFFHNLIASTFILPAQLTLDDLQHVVSGPDSLYPVSAWDGRLGLENIAALLFNLALVSLGVGAAWKRWRFSGLLPLLIFLGYNLASALARTSGGRYIVPVDWALVLYYALGWMMGLGLLWKGAGGKFPWGEVPSSTSDGQHSWRQVAALAGGVFLLIGLALPVSERLIPLRYSPDAPQQWLSRLEEEEVLQSLGVSQAELERFLQDDRAVLLAGKALYPRFYQIEEGEPDQYSYLRPMKFPRLTFTVIGPRGGIVLLPLESSPPVFQHGSDVLVLGCQGEYVDAAAVIGMGERTDSGWAYRRFPQAPLECPLRQPVCDDNRVCR